MTTAATYDLPNISIDVVPVIVNITTNKLDIIVSPRIYEPFLNEFALPGVLLTPHERLTESAYRALETKTRIPAEQVQAIYDLGTFDNPDRDPRGATVSIAKIAIISSDFNILTTGSKQVPLEAAALSSYALPFDHNTIVKAAAGVFAEKFLASKTFTKSVLGNPFTTKVVRGIMEQLNSIDSGADHSYDPSNLTRQLKSSGWVTVQETLNPYTTVTSTLATSTSRGRPSRTWDWND
jgi:8-oxo-dGTP diphosphatase